MHHSAGSAFPAPAAAFSECRSLVAAGRCSCGAGALAAWSRDGYRPRLMAAETIGERIRRERVRLGLHQSELAVSVGVGAPYISKVETDSENPSHALVIRIAHALDVSADEMLITARRIPRDIAEQLATDPAAAIRFLGTWHEWLRESDRR